MAKMKSESKARNVQEDVRDKYQQTIELQGDDAADHNVEQKRCHGEKNHRESCRQGTQLA
ncbi:MAG: hypothetical protein BMS9Abin09_0965 [Gammaproteobacteria bacterium]|nr:MAG: hypothetical protein BMS9Abin09_0965 [Gammaproteobacteria bacterium]